MMRTRRLGLPQEVDPTPDAGDLELVGEEAGGFLADISSSIPGRARGVASLEQGAGVDGHGLQRSWGGPSHWTHVSALQSPERTMDCAQVLVRPLPQALTRP